MANMFRCVLAGGGGAGIPLIVTCASGFAGLTITCTDGNTTLTGECPSSSPYEVTFQLPNIGTWTVSGVVSGTTYSESVLVNNFDVTLNNNHNVTVNFYSAANDTVSYVGPVDNQTHTIVTDSNGHADAVITIPHSATATITFTSSVAKNPNSLSDFYSDSKTITTATTDVYLMPGDGSKTLYWYGYIGDNCETLSSENGWSGANPFTPPTYNTNDIYMPGDGTYARGIGVKNSITITKTHLISMNTGTNTSWGVSVLGMNSKNTSDNPQQLTNQVTRNVIQYNSDNTTTPYILVYINKGSDRSGYIYAFWYE